MQGLRELRRSRFFCGERQSGRISDVYFDEESWEVRYLVVDLGWLSGRRVVVAPSTPAGSVRLTDELQAEDSLCSAREVLGYQVRGSDGPLGWATDVVFDLHCWSVRYVLVGARRWWSRAGVLVQPGFIQKLDWFERSMHVQLRRCDLG